MGILLLLILMLLCGLLLDLILPAIAFFTTGQGWAPIGAAFSGDGWNRAISYITGGGNWDRWLCLVVLILSVLLWILTLVVLSYRGHPGRALFSIFGLVAHILVVYIYLAWPNPEVFQMWQRIMLYVAFVLYPLSQLFNLGSKE